MKKIHALTLLLIFIFIGCSKNKEEGPDIEPEPKNNLDQLISADRQKEVTAMGFTIYKGANPPNLTGSYVIDKMRYDAKNKLVDKSSTQALGVTRAGFTMTITEQQSQNIKLQLTNHGFESQINTPIIYGSGNNFTILSHFYAIGGSGANFTFPYAKLISGTLDGNVIKNLKIAIFGLKLDKPNAGNVTVDGEITIWSDHDYVSGK